MPERAGENVRAAYGKQFPGVPVIRDLSGTAPDEGSVILVPDSENIPLNDIDLLQSWRHAGVRFLFIGPDPLGEQVIREDGGRLQSEQERVATALAEGQQIPGSEAPGRWNTGGADDASAARLAYDELADRLQVNVTGFHNWDAVFIHPPSIPDHADTLVLGTEGSDTTTAMALILKEKDGSHWYHVLPAGPAFRTHLVHERTFHYFYGGSARGGTDDHARLSAMETLSIGLSMHLAPQPPGDHAFTISTPRIWNAPPAMDAIAGQEPDIPMLSPSYRRYRLDDDGSTAGPLPRERGTGGDLHRNRRWIPLESTTDKEGVVRGWPSSIWLTSVDGRPVVHGWIGKTSLHALRSDADAIQRAVHALGQPAWILGGGSPAFSYPAGTTIPLHADILGSAGSYTAGFSLRSEDHHVYWSTQRAVTVKEAGASSLQTDIPGSVTKQLAGSNVIAVMELTHTNGTLVDSLSQSLLMTGPATVPPRPVTVDEHVFHRDGKPFSLNGINYWPLTVNGRPLQQATPHWLDPSQFDPDPMKRDLDLLAAAGINALAVQYHDVNQAPQLRFLMQEANARDMVLYLFVAYLQPMDQNLERAAALIDAANLAGETTVFAFDIAWEPHLGRKYQRRRFDDDWRRWLIEQYGTIDHAETVLGRPLWRHEGKVTGPPDSEITRDGPHRDAVAVYRRFVDDLMSRRYGEVRRFLRERGCDQLLSARNGYGGTGNDWGNDQFPLDLAADAVHFDFISPEGWALNGSQRQFDEASFITSYARGVGGGKPVVWMEFGATVGRNPTPASLANQARVYRNMYRLIERSEAAGAFGWWYPSGYRVDERTDMGIVNPDATPRPAMNEIQAFARSRENWTPASLEWNGMTVDRALDARGVSALWDRHRVAFGDAAAAGNPPEIRPRLFAESTADGEPSSIGHRPWLPPCPPEGVNAEWYTVTINGQPVNRAPWGTIDAKAGTNLKMELINSGPATWAASEPRRKGSVTVSAVHASGKTVHLPVPETAFGESTIVTWTPPEAGDWTLRAHLDGLGGFGETLPLRVQD